MEQAQENKTEGKKEISYPKFIQERLDRITGGIAEAYYKEIPRSISEQVVKPFPKIFNKILDAVRKETVYGITCKIVD